MLGKGSLRVSSTANGKQSMLLYKNMLNRNNGMSGCAMVFTRSLAGRINLHRKVPGNTGDESFDFTTHNYGRVATILAKYPENYKASAIIPLLDLAQRQNKNYLTVAAIKKVAQIVGVNPMRVNEVATFYTMFNRVPVGKYFIQLCGTTPCMACGAQEIKKTMLDHLGVKEDEITKDGKFSLIEVECLGACANAPMVQINDDYYEMLTPKTAVELLEACKKDQPPAMNKWGSLPMNGQLSCEGPKGKTTLFNPDEFSIEKHFRKDLPEPKEDPALLKKAMNY